MAVSMLLGRRAPSYGMTGFHGNALIQATWDLHSNTFSTSVGTCTRNPAWLADLGIQRKGGLASGTSLPFSTGTPQSWSKWGNQWSWDVLGYPLSFYFVHLQLLAHAFVPASSRILVAWGLAETYDLLKSSRMDFGLQSHTLHLLHPLSALHHPSITSGSVSGEKATRRKRKPDWNNSEDDQLRRKTNQFPMFAHKNKIKTSTLELMPIDSSSKW